MAKIATFDLDETLEALRAVRDPTVNVKGMLCCTDIPKVQQELLFTAWAPTSFAHLQDWKHYGRACGALKQPLQCMSC
jgi:hypothetical protein